MRVRRKIAYGLIITGATLIGGFAGEKVSESTIDSVAEQRPAIETCANFMVSQLTSHPQVDSSSCDKLGQFDTIPETGTTKVNIVANITHDLESKKDQSRRYDILVGTVVGLILSAGGVFIESEDAINREKNNTRLIMDQQAKDLIEEAFSDRQAISSEIIGYMDAEPPWKGAEQS